MAEIGLEALIENADAREAYSRSKNLNEKGRFKESLEALGIAFRHGLDTTPFALVVTVGAPETEAALHLLGSGVDPSMFMSLQRFLPSVDDADAIIWNTRDSGHAGNWTRENVDYCLGAALKIILQIQHAQFGAHAIHSNTSLKMFSQPKQMGSYSIPSGLGSGVDSDHPARQLGS